MVYFSCKNLVFLFPFLSPPFLHPLSFLQVDLGMGVKPPGYYIQAPSGLFPAPIPHYSPELERICGHFELLGLFLAKCIQDGRRVDIPLSLSFLKLMCSAPRVPAEEKNVKNEKKERREKETLNVPKREEEEAGSQQRHYQDNRGDDGGAGVKEQRLIAEASEEETEEDEIVSTKDASKEDAVEDYHVSQEEADSLPSSPLTPPSLDPWFRGLLTRDDFRSVDAHRGQFVSDLCDLVCRRDAILTNPLLTEEERQQRVSKLTLREEAGGGKVEDL